MLQNITTLVQVWTKIEETLGGVDQQQLKKYWESMEVIGKNEKKIALWNGLGLSTLSCYRITQNELKLCSEESYEGHQVTESNFEQLDFAYWLMVHAKIIDLLLLEIKHVSQ